MDDSETGAARWLAMSNGAFLAAGLVAYATQINLALLTVVALVPALRGLVDLKRGLPEGRDQIWADRAFTYAAGTMGVLAMWTLIPYAATVEGISLWSLDSYAMLGILLSSAGMLAWNYAAWQCLADELGLRMLRSYTLLHVFILVISCWYVFQGDAGTYVLDLRGEMLDVVDLRFSPALAAAPGLLWAMLLWRAQPAQK